MIGEGFTMDDLRYQVDLLTALNQKLNSDINIYEKICNNSNTAVIYVNCINDSVRVIGKLDDIFDAEITCISDIYSFIEMFKEQFRDEITNLFFLERTNAKEAMVECCLNDNKTWYFLKSVIFENSDGIVSDKIISIHNFTKNHNKTEELTYLAYYDNLTNLYNRNYFITKLRDFVDKAEKNKRIVSVMLADIDDFRKISDSRGLIIGDEIIQNVGLFINSLTNSNLIASRFDSDLFCIAIYDPNEKNNIDSVYSRIKEYLANPIKLTDGSEITVTISVGVSEYPEATNNPLALINCAEVVMIKSKEKGKNMICYYDSQIINAFLHDVELENKLKEALYTNKLFLNYQPQFYSDSRKLRGVEALIRWKDANGMMISPSEFIPISEKNGSIIDIGDFVLDECIRKFMEWQRRFDYDMILSVNISSIQYKRADFVPKVLSVLNKYGTNPHNLELEITESVLIDDFDSIVSKMLILKDYGIKVSLDDFGTGFSSLSYLVKLPIDTLKIDKSFISNVTLNESSRVVTESIISMANRLGFNTIAEGVETEAQLNFLTGINCDIIQGYYLGKPVSADKIEELLIRLI